MDFKSKKKGIALVTLIITVIIVIILASVGIGVIINKNYFKRAEDMKFNSSIKNYREELYDYIENEEIISGVRYNQEDLFADKSGIYYNGKKLESKTIKDIITTISDEDLDIIKIYKGDIVYVGGTKDYQEKVNMPLSYSSLRNLIVNVKADENSTINDKEINVEINNTSFTLEVIYSEIDTKTEDKYNFVYSNSFNIYYDINYKKIIVQMALDSQNKIESNFNLHKDKISKLTFTFDSVTKKGALYINGDLCGQTTFLSETQTFDKVFLKGDKDYYAIRIYDKCLNYSEVKQNDILDISNYGIWGK